MSPIIIAVIGLIIVYTIIIVVLMIPVKSQFIYKPNLDSAGNDLYGKKMSVSEAQSYATKTSGIAGFVMLDDGTALFKHTINPTTNQCWNNLCSKGGSGLYIKI
jgi:hypothetical protein